MSDFKKVCNDENVEVQQLKYNTPWSNRVEGVVWENKRTTRQAVRKTKLSVDLCDYCVVLISLIRYHTVHGIPSLNG